MQAPQDRAWAVLALATLLSIANSVQTLTFAILIARDVGRDVAGSAAYGIAGIAGAIFGAMLIWLAGARWGVLVALIVWTIGAVLASLGGGAGLFTARMLQGLTGSAVLIGAYQAIAEWFPAGYHGLGASLIRGLPLIANFLINLFGSPWARLGYRASFIAMAVLGAILAVLWTTTLAPRPSDPPPDRAEAGALAMASPAAWALIIGAFLVGLYSNLLFVWLPPILQRDAHLVRSVVPVVVSVIAMILGALFSDLAIQSGTHVGAARGVTTVIAGALMVSIAVIAAAPPALVLTAILALAYSGYQLWTVTMYAAVMDAAPPAGVGLAIGLGVYLSQIATVAISYLGRDLFIAGSLGGIAILMSALAVLAMPLSALVWRIRASGT